MASGVFQRNNESATEQECTEYFRTNLPLVVALKHVLCASERQLVHAWLTKFYEMNGNVTEQTLRNDYLWFLLVQMDTCRLSMPFLRVPPSAGPLLPIAQAVDLDVYKDILSAANRSIAAFSSVDGNESMVHVGKKLIRPSQFVEQQPQPKHGLIVYGCCFSNED